MQNITVEAIGVFLWDTSPATLWNYLGVNATGEHVFDTGTVAAGSFKVKHTKTLDDFWPLVPAQ